MPDQIDIFNFAKKQAAFKVRYCLKDFPRISNFGDEKKPVEVVLDFWFEGDIPCVKGVIRLDATLICQRCLQDFDFDLKSDFRLAFLRQRQQEQWLEADFETMVITDNEVSTVDFLTDEILLATPMSPMHDFSCITKFTETPKIQKAKNPFAILTKMKKE